MNRLADAQSPYLQQHANNPVDWWPWCDAAFDEARQRNVPVFLSVGYAACHWCHVMAHESFEDDATATYLNEYFISIKVDREERPDVDAVYMDATQAMTGQGGWPMSAFLTPEREPFFCGTYFPPAERAGMPAFRDVLVAVHDSWTQRRSEIAEFAADVTRRLGRPRVAARGEYDERTLTSAVAKLLTESDPVNGGFGGSPKFPPSMVLDFLLRHYRRTGDQRALSLADAACDRMARGGIYDQLGGGFARYSVDAEWIVPHFEKMLYDNALLLDVYTQWWANTDDPHARRIAVETADFLLRELRTTEGGFAASLDADTAGVEGDYYVWTPTQLAEVLGRDDAEWVAELCDVSEAGTFERGSSVLQLRADPDDAPRWDRLRSRLLEARSRRVRPGRDEKIVAAWNGLAVTALVRTGVLFNRPDYVAAAVACGRLLRDVHMTASGQIRRTSRNGTPGSPGTLDDYAAAALSFVTLLAVDEDSSWLDAAERLLAHVLSDFVADGDFFDVDTETSAQLIWRPKDPTDNAAPSGVALAAEALLTTAAITGSNGYREAAERALAATFAVGSQAPRFAGRALAVAESVHSGPLEIAVVGRHPGLVRTAIQTAPWGTPLVTGAPGTDIELMRGRELVDGQPAAYVCRNFACRRPITDPVELNAELQAG